ncbi:MAG: glutamine amidotransferase, partial [Actinomycetia bacterium]|nr:glutamine amidotransferase [Actinomycetes bacterium]MCP5033559.1 glutamine amidotransferase [Actinomycetes bacterium]
MKPFLLLATRAEDTVADNEYDAFLTYSGLDES